MKKGFKIGLMLLFIIALMSVIAPSKAISLDKDVGTMFFMPESQINVDVVTSTIQITTFNCDRWLEYKNYENTDLIMTCNPEMLVTTTVISYSAIKAIAVQANSGNQNEINNFSTGDIAVNLGLRSASITTTSLFINEIKSVICVPSNQLRGVNTRLDIGERYVNTYFSKII